MSYSFEAEPRVVKTRTKYKQNDNESGSATESSNTIARLMQDTRIKMMQPLEQELEYVKREKERIKVENMHNQLWNFKKNKKKMTPYDVKPSPNPRIEVNLEFFLTDPNNVNPVKTTIDTQTDIFREKPPSPTYVPKKTGIDISTQVEDNDLFVFDREVAPIVNVIVTKTLEQSLLEIEEEEEILKMKQYKLDFIQRKKVEKERWQDVLKKEKNEEEKKEKMLGKYRERESKKEAVSLRLQAYNIAGGYLRRLEENTIKQLVNDGYYQNEFENQLKSDFMDWLVDRTQAESAKIELVNESVQTLFGEPVPKLMKKKDRIVKLRDIAIKKKERRRQNFNPQMRVLRVFYKDEYNPASYFVNNFVRYIDGALNDYEQAYEARAATLQAQADNNEITEDDHRNIINTEFPEAPAGYKSFHISTVRRLGFCVANNMYYEPLPGRKKVFAKAVFYSESGDQIGSFDRYTTASKLKFAKYYHDIRDRKVKVSDDEGIVIHLDRLKEEVQHILFVAVVEELEKVASYPGELQHGRFTINDFDWNFIFDSSPFSTDYKIEELAKAPDPSAEEVESQHGLLFGYLVTRNKSSGRNGWFVEQIKVPKAFFVKEEDDFLSHGLHDLINRGHMKELQAKGLLNKSMSQASEPEGLLKNLQKKKTTKEEPKEKEPPKEKEGNELYTAAFAAVEAHIDQDISQITEALVDTIRSENEALLKSAPWGFEFYIKDKLLERPKQIRKHEMLWDLTFRRKPEPVIEKKEEATEEEENGEGREDNGEDD